MSPTITIVRHAEARHNVEPNGDALRDPHLTQKGEGQAKTLQSTFPHMSRIKGVISSPMRRAVQTALLGFGPAIQKGNMKVILIPELQESSARPSDTGSPAEVLQAEFGNVLDTQFLFDGWEYKDASTTYGGRDQAKVAERARLSRVYIRSVAKTLSNDDHLVVVAHSGFIRHLIQGAPKFGNAEFRACKFVDILGDDSLALLAEVSLKTH
ncbi:histidine phosphatase superfamily [Xylaria bambusicola]|uniref:histidine phosphatase superfamily n=1 Tax=Xylaria bambusicola TaxID=326684 RepID=UPI002008596A|nr:histidine phosphatase superfamily [Xylaria bambusicola]KAI0506528.1 histidine phosphatase superfamily [Xylaria bambusicola]